jgi:DnaJ family protein C protein 11
MSVGIPAGVTLKIKVNRGSQNYIFPILLCEEIVPTPIIYGTVTPLIVYYMVKVLVVNPYLDQQRKRDKEKQKEVNATKMAEKRKEAEAAVSLMQETVARIRQTEENRNGLIIEHALYGKLFENGQRLESVGCDIVDVTVPLQVQVKDSKLTLHESSKASLPGFYDPCVGEDKHLYITYTFHNIRHEVIITDNEQLRIPKQSHRIGS